MAVFDDIERTQIGPAPEAMSRFEWMNVCANPYAGHVRTQVEAMFANYPDDEKERFVERLRSDDDSEHRSAVLELILHEWMLALGHTIVAIEPELEHTTKRPDFLVQTADGHRFFLEAVARQEEHDHLAGVRDAINAVESPVYLNTRIRGVPTEPLSPNKIARKVRDFVATVDTKQNRDDWPSLQFEEKGTRFHLKPWSLKSEANRNARTIGVYSSGARVMASTGDLDRVLKKKASRYGELPHPYLVATTTAEFFIGTDELIAALYGTEAMGFNPNDPILTGQPFRQANGIWRGLQNRWTHTGLSAVVLIPDLNMTSLASRLPLLMLHPEPRHAFIGDWLNAETHAFASNVIAKTKDGEILGKQFGLPEGWPPK